VTCSRTLLPFKAEFNHELIRLSLNAVRRSTGISGTCKAGLTWGLDPTVLEEEEYKTQGLRAKTRRWAGRLSGSKAIHSDLHRPFLLRDIVGARARAHQRVTSFMKQQMRVRDYINKRKKASGVCVYARARAPREPPCVLGGHTLNSRQLADSIGKL